MLNRVGETCMTMRIEAIVPRTNRVMKVCKVSIVPETILIIVSALYYIRHDIGVRHI